MRNLEHPVQQTLYEDTIALYAARYAEVQERLQDPERSFTTFVHTELAGVRFYTQPGTAELAGLTVEQKMLRPHLGQTLDNIAEAEWETDLAPNSEVEIDPEHKELRVIRYLVEKLDEVKEVEKLETIAALAIIAGRNKPDSDRIEEVLKKRPDTLAIEEQTFRRAHNALKVLALEEGERDAITRALPKLQARIDTGDPSGKAATTLSKYYRGTYAARVLERLMDGHTAQRDVTDEIDFTNRKAPAPTIIEREPNVPVNVVRLPFPLLPPQRSRGEEPRHQPAPKIVPESSVTESQEGRQQPPVRHTFRTDWILDLAVDWEYGGDIVPDMDLVTSYESNKYQGAILHDEWGAAFAIVSDTDILGNALYYAFVRELRDPDTGQPIHWQTAYRGFKRDARARGVKRMEHAGQDFYKRLMNNLLDAYIEHLQAREAGEIFIAPPPPESPEQQS